MKAIYFDVEDVLDSGSSLSVENRDALLGFMAFRLTLTKELKNSRPFAAHESRPNKYDLPCSKLAWE